MARKYISFEEVEQLATIEELAAMLNLDVKRSGRQLRSTCPVHGGDERALAITPDVRSRRGSLGVFFCQSGKEGGDRIALVAHCMEIGQQDAAFFIQEQFGAEFTSTETVTSTCNSTVSKDRATVPQNQKREPTRQKSEGFDPAKFAAGLTFSEEVAALGLAEEVAKRYKIGMHRNKLYLPVCPEDVDPPAWMEWHEGQLKLPSKWLVPSNVVKLRRA